MARKSKKQNFSKKPLLVILILLFCIIGVVLLFGIRNKHLNFYSYSNQDSQKNVPYSSILVPLKEELYLRTSPITNGQAVWITDYNNLNIVTGGEFAGANIINEGETIGLKYILDSFFEGQGFEKNEINTFSTLSDPNQAYQVDSFGYTKGDVKCLVNLFVNSKPSGIFFCGTINQEKEQLQNEFKNVLYGPDSQYPLQNNEAAVIDVTNINNNFASGTDNRYLNGVFEPSGANWIAAKVNGSWQLVFEGQDYPPCSLIDQYSIPQEFYKNCFDSSTNSPRFPQAQP